MAANSAGSWIRVFTKGTWSFKKLVYSRYFKFYDHPYLFYLVIHWRELLSFFVLPFRKKLIKCFRNWFPVMSSCRWRSRRYVHLWKVEPVHNSLKSKIHQWRVSVSKNLLYIGVRWFAGGFFVVLSIGGCPENYCRRNVEVHGFLPPPLFRWRGKSNSLPCSKWRKDFRRWFHSVTHGNLSRIYLDRYRAPWRDHTNRRCLLNKNRLNDCGFCSWGFRQASTRRGHRCRVPAKQPYLFT